MRRNILILCTGNSCRSQMAHGYLATLLGDQANVYSAGTTTHGVNPHAIAIMAEDGVDISQHTSNQLDEYLHLPFDWVITVCDNAKEACPIFPGKGQRIHHSFPDPAGAQGYAEEVQAEFRRVRDMVKKWCEAFVQKMDEDKS